MWQCCHSNSTSYAVNSCALLVLKIPLDRQVLSIVISSLSSDRENSSGFDIRVHGLILESL